VVDIFDEVDEDLRADRAKLLLRQYAPALIAVAVLVVVGAGGWRAWQWYDGKHSAQVADSYIAAMKAADGKTAADKAAAAADFAAIADKAGAGYRTLARLHEAALKADAGDLPGASALWDQIAADSSADPLLRDLATLLWAQHEAGHAPDAEVLGRLAPLASQQNPYHGLAQETQALIYMGEGKSSLAKALFSQIAADPNVPDGVRNRADGLLEKLNG
jgi:hypothetical protein